MWILSCISFLPTNVGCQFVTDSYRCLFHNSKIPLCTQDFLGYSIALYQATHADNEFVSGFKCPACIVLQIYFKF